LIVKKKSEKFTIYDLRFTIERPEGSAPLASIGNRQSAIGNQCLGFTLIEVLVVMSLLSLIILALMTVFNSTQAAFRAGVTQTDVLEGSRAAMDLMVSDLKLTSSSGGASNFISGGVNFFSLDNQFVNPSYAPLLQNLTGSMSGAQRTNVLSCFFLLGRQNTSWTGVGYVVDSTSTSPLYPLYRFFAQTNIQANPQVLFAAFTNAIYNQQWTNMSHLIDGVVDLRLHAYDVNGYQMTNIYQYEPAAVITNQNVWFSVPYNGEVGFYFFGNTIPASVELQIGVLEDRPLKRADSLANPAITGLSPAQTNYLAQQAGRVHVFRQRVLIPNVDPSAYQ
jgi:prepilin-type N-terminal cleavage/methylation domain-containing protein